MSARRKRRCPRAEKRYRSATPLAAPDVFEQVEGVPLPKRFTVVNHPSIYAFPAPKLKNTGVAIVVAPGGGHSQLVIDKEGWEVAEWLNKNGISAFVLKYRLARAKDSHYTVAGDALADATHAMSLVRSHAADWDINPERIGIMGFSAGGELAALMETRFDKDSRPDFAVVVYPGFRPGAITVPKDAPPTFFVCADDDPSHVVTTVNLYLDLRKTGYFFRDAHLRNRQARLRPACAANIAGLHLARSLERVDGR